jgi:inner membrane protein involved in colicin E2 resistance
MPLPKENKINQKGFPTNFYLFVFSNNPHFLLAEENTSSNQNLLAVNINLTKKTDRFNMAEVISSS